MFTVCKTVRFDAAHQLLRFPEEHKCHRLHGHNYLVEVELSAMEVDEQGVVVDYSRISDAIRQRYDHQNLNDFPEFNNNPTAELIARAIVDLLDVGVLNAINQHVPPDEWVKVRRVRVYETHDSWAEWTP